MALTSGKQPARDMVIAAGFDSMKHFVELSGESHQTLLNWHKKKFDRFSYILNGVKLKHKVWQKAKKVNK